MNAWLLVACGGALGSMGRYGAGLMAGRLLGHGFPWATLAVNVLGSLLMGLLIAVLARDGGTAHAEWRLFLAVGVLGGFTTFSTFSLDAVTLLTRGEWSAALAYMTASLALALLALWGGMALGRLV